MIKGMQRLRQRYLHVHVWHELENAQALIEDCVGAAAACNTPLRIWLAISVTPPGPLGTKTVCAFDCAPMSRSVSKYCVMSSSSETFSLLSVSLVPLVIESFRPSIIAARCRAIPRPCKCC